MLRALTHEDRAWPRYELIDGELLVTPSPRLAHQLAAIELCRMLDEYLAKSSVGLALMSPSDLELRPGTITQPDVFVIPPHTALHADRLEWSDVRALLLAIEVISPSSWRSDRVLKRDFYLENGVKEYWIVDLEARVFACWKPGQGTPALHHDVLAWAPAEHTDLEICVRDFFGRIDSKTGRREM